MGKPGLLVLVTRFVERVLGADTELFERTLWWVRRVSDGYDPSYFPVGAKDDGGFRQVAVDVFVRCSMTHLKAAPFEGRRPFYAYAEDRSPDWQIRALTFTNPSSCTRLRLLEIRYENRTLFPALYRDHQRRRTIREGLNHLVADGAVEVVGWEKGKPNIWACADGQPDAPLFGSELRQALHELPDLPVQTLVWETLRRRGPSTKQELREVIDRVAPQPAPPPLRPEAIDLDAVTIRRLRQALQATWDALPAEERAFARRIAGGATMVSEVGTHPRMSSKTTVTEIGKRLCHRFQQAAAAVDGRRWGGPMLNSPLVLELIVSIIDLSALEPGAHLELVP